MDQKIKKAEKKGNFKPPHEMLIRALGGSKNALKCKGNPVKAGDAIEGV